MASVVSSGLSSRFIDMQVHKFARVTVDYAYSELIVPSYEMWQLLQLNLYGVGSGQFQVHTPEGNNQWSVQPTGTGTYDINLAPYAYANGKVRVVKNSGEYVEGRIVLGVIPV